MGVVFSQAAPFTGAAYEYLRADDELPSYREIADEPDPLCRVRLFQPFSRWTFYVCAATEYQGIEGPVLTGYCVSPLGRDCDEFGDQALAEIAAVRLGGLPPEDLALHPVVAAQADTRHVVAAVDGERPMQVDHDVSFTMGATLVTTDASESPTAVTSSRFDKWPERPRMEP